MSTDQESAGADQVETATEVSGESWLAEQIWLITLEEGADS